jgi:hypothetical protein
VLVIFFSPVYAQLDVHPTNPRYFTDSSGKAIYLTGSHAWYLIQTNDRDTSPENSYDDMIDYLDFMQSHGHNFVRLWTAFSYQSTTPFPWQRTGPGTASDGNPQFDMTNFNQAFFDRVKMWVDELESRDMYCSIMFFGSSRGFYTSWSTIAWHEDNNINPELDSFSRTDAESFFRPNSEALEIQRMTVRKFIDELNYADNIIWEIMNEAPVSSIDWQRNMVNYVIKYESAKPKQHLVGITGGGNPSGMGDLLLTGPHHWFSPDKYNMGYYEGGDADYTSKIVINDTDHIRNPSETGWGFSALKFVPAMKKWVWQTFTRGNHPIFMDWYDSHDSNPEYGQTSGKVNPEYDPIREAMGHTLFYAERMDLASMLPTESSAHCSTTYCLRNPGAAYLIYQPGSGSFSADISAGDYQYEWFNPNTGSVADSGTISTPGGQMSFKPPFSGDAVLYLF